MAENNQLVSISEVKTTELQNALQILNNKNLTPELIQSPEFIDAWEIIDNTAKVLDALVKASKNNIKDVVKEHFLETGENSIKTAKFNYTYKTESTRMTFDTETFKAEHPDLYTQYTKVSNVTDSVTVTKVKTKASE